MPMIPVDTSEEARKVQIDALRRLGPAGRLRAGIELTHASRKLLIEGLRRRHPDYSEEQLRMACFKLLLPGKLFQAACPQARNILP